MSAILSYDLNCRLTYLKIKWVWIQKVKVPDVVSQAVKVYKYHLS